MSNTESKEVSLTKEDLQRIESVFQALKEREIHPRGTFDKARRWYSSHDCSCCSIRRPSRAHTFSEMVHCRTKKHVKAIFVEFKDEFLALEKQVEAKKNK